MKKITILVSVILASCSTVPIEKNTEISHRIIGKEYQVYEGHGYQIVEVDGREYLVLTSGGICPLVSDSIK